MRQGVERALLEDPRTAATRPLLLAVDHARHRIAGVDQAAQLPATLGGDKPLELTIYVPEAALPAWRGLLLIHSHGDVALAVNGQPGTLLAPRRSELFLEFAPHDQEANARPAPADCRTFAIDPACLQPGVNRLTLTNATVSAIEYTTGIGDNSKTTSAYDTHELERVSFTYQRIVVESLTGQTSAEDDWTQ